MDRKEMEQNGFRYGHAVVELAGMVAEDKLYEADVFCLAYWMADNTVSATMVDVTIGERYEPVKMTLSRRNGAFIFWFALVHPGKEEFERDYDNLYGFKTEFVQDALPDFWKRIVADFSNDIKKLDKDNQKAIGSRMRIIESMNQAIEAKSVDYVLNRRAVLEQRKRDFYLKDDQAGMF